MSDESEKKEKMQDETDILHTIPVKRHLWPDEVESRKIRRQNKRLKIWLAVVAVLVFPLGWIFGTFRPFPFTQSVHSSLNSLVKGDSSGKIDEVRDVMENDWFFASEIDDLDDRLTDQALKGMTSNSEDTHTEYMSKSEIEEFTQSINRNFVGIGVQFTSTQDGLHLITRVMHDSPAEKAGVQAGDIIHAVDGTIVDNLSAQQIKELVQGEEGTMVTIEFLRDGESVTLKIERGEVSSTVSSKIREDGIGYLNIAQFGNTTADEVKESLDEFANENVTELIIDLRDDGGGYLEALQGVLDLFLEKDTVFLQREYSDGSSEQMKTEGGTYEQFGPIVILVNGNTASAAEAFTLAMKECRDDVTLIGTTTYGKGTVQVTKYFDDGSAIKYTNSKWMSPSGVWVNGTGIEPDQTVELAPILTSSYQAMEDGETVAVDTVSDFVKEAQQALEFLGYDCSREDGYFDDATLSALQQFEKDQDMSVTETLDSKTYEALISQVVIRWNTDESADSQMNAAAEELKR